MSGEGAPSHVSIRLLGPPEVLVAGERATFRNRRSLALLALLAVDARPHRRDRLMSMLWPEADTRRARGSMRSTLHRLREALGPGRSWLLVDQDTVQLTVDPDVWVDVHALAAEATDLDTADRTSIDRAAASLGDLDRGVFAEGLDIDGAPDLSGWIAHEREHWGGRLERLTDRVLDGLAAHDDWDGAAEAAAAWVARHPLSDRAHLRLIEARAKLGDRAGAEAAWLRCRDMWLEELGAPPSSATVEAVRELLGPAEVPAPPASARSSRVAVRHEPLPMIGRENELSLLLDGARLATEGERAVVRLEAAAGLGKSRLLDLFVSELEARSGGTDVIVGRSHEAGARLTYQLFIDALRGRVEQIHAPDDLLDDVWLTELSRLLPEIRERYPDLEPPLVDDGELARSRLFEAVYRLIAALAGRRPVALVFDDVHRCDPGSLDLLARVVARAAHDDVPLLVVLSLRPDEIDSHLGAFLDEVSDSGPTALVALDPLGADEIGRLVTADDEGAADAVAGALATHTGGVPLLLEGMVIALVESGDVVRDVASGLCVVDELAARLAEGAHLPVPARLEEVVGRRVASIDPVERRLLNAAAVLGAPSDLADLCAVGAVEQDEGFAALDRLRARRLLVLDDAVELTYRPAHDLLRQAAKTIAGAERCRLLHRRAFERLRERGAVAAEVAHHAEAAALWDDAFAYRSNALQQALGALAWQEATSHGRAAVALLARTNPSEDAVTALYRELSIAMQLAGRSVECDHVLAQGQERAAGAGSYHLELELRLLRLDFRINPHPLWDPEAADVEMVALRELASSNDDRIGIARVDVREATRIHMTGDRAEEGSAIAERCLDHLPESFGDERLEVLSALATFFAWDGNDEGVVRAAQQARAGWRDRNQPRRVARTHFVVNLHRLLCGRLSEARADVEEGRELARRSGDRWHGVTLGELEARLAYEAGDIDAAAAVLIEALDDCRARDLHGLVFGCAPGLALLELERGNPAAAVEAMEAVPELYEAMANEGGSIRSQWGADDDPLVSVAASLPRTAAGPVYGAGVMVRLAIGDLVGARRLDQASRRIRLDDVAVLRLDELAFARAAVSVAGIADDGRAQAVEVAGSLSSGRAMASRRGQRLLQATFAEAEARLRQALGERSLAEELRGEALRIAEAAGAVTRMRRLVDER